MSKRTRKSEEHSQERAIKRLKKTDIYKGWKNAIRSGLSFPLKRHREELADLFKTRPARYLHNGKWNAKKLNEVNAFEMHVRGRSAELMAEAKDIRTHITRVNEAMLEYMILEEVFKGGAVTDRRSKAATVIEKGLKLESRLDNFIDIAEDLIEDIDKAGWSLQRMMDGIVVMSKPEYELRERG